MTDIFSKNALTEHPTYEKEKTIFLRTSKRNVWVNECTLKSLSKFVFLQNKSHRIFAPTHWLILRAEAVTCPQRKTECKNRK